MQFPARDRQCHRVGRVGLCPRYRAPGSTDSHKLPSLTERVRSVDRQVKGNTVGTGRTALVFSCVVLLGSCSRAHLAPAGGVGLSIPTDLLSYIDRSDAPAYCRTPESLLAEVEQAVLSDQMHTGASASLLEGATIRVTSSLPSEGGCRNEYLADIWTERDSRSSGSYMVRAFGRVRKICSGRIYRVDDVEAIARPARLVDQKLRDLFVQCRHPPGR